MLSLFLNLDQCMCILLYIYNIIFQIFILAHACIICFCISIAEPNLFPKYVPGVNISATQLGYDLLTLHDLLRYDPDFQPHFRNALLVGPDITRPNTESLKYLKE